MKVRYHNCFGQKSKEKIVDSANKGMNHGSGSDLNFSGMHQTKKSAIPFDAEFPGMNFESQK